MELEVTELESPYLQMDKNTTPESELDGQWFTLLRGLRQCLMPWPATDNGGRAKGVLYSSTRSANGPWQVVFTPWPAVSTSW